MYTFVETSPRWLKSGFYFFNKTAGKIEEASFRPFFVVKSSYLEKKIGTNQEKEVHFLKTNKLAVFGLAANKKPDPKITFPFL